MIKNINNKIASLLTLGLLNSLVFTIALVVAYFFNLVDIPSIIAFTFGLNLFGWILSPIISDWMFMVFYKIHFYSRDEFAAISPEVARYISEVCADNKIKFPKIGVIDDDNPTAFTYGSVPSNARLVFSKGLFVYINKREVEAVFAHEIGHIVHYDFLVMTMANALVQILYEIYVLCMGRGKGVRRGKGLLVYIGLISYLFYTIATYILLLLSRTREYYADEFSAKTTGNPNNLSSALIKIAYGMVTLESDTKTKRLLESTRAMGIMDSRSARGIGLVARFSEHDLGKIGQVLAYDFVSPWAVISELGSTHPLTGKRIKRLDDMAFIMGKSREYGIHSVINNMDIDKKKLFRGFYIGVFIYYLYNISFVLGIASIVLFDKFSLFFMLLGSSIIIKTLYQFSDRKIQPAQLSDLMTDIYASPIKGKKVELKGQIIGRRESGHYLSEDLMFRDESGIIFLDYNSKFGFIGDLFFALRKVSKIISQQVVATGWFFRSNHQMVSIGKMQTESKLIRSYPRLWGLVVGFFWLILAFVTDGAGLSWLDFMP